MHLNFLKLTLVFSILVFFHCRTSFLSAQSDFASATIELKNGMTKLGYIHYKDWKTTPSQILYKDSRTTAPVFLDATSINSFSVSGEKFIVADVSFQPPSEPTPMAENTKEEDVVKKQTVFLNILVDGEKSLYVHKNKNNQEFLFIKNKNHIDLLESRKKVLVNTDEYKEMEVETYKTQISDYLTGYPEMDKKLKKIKYSTEQFLALFDTYYDFVQLKPKYRK